MASPSCRPPGGSPDGPRLVLLSLALPLPPATPPPSSAAPPPLPAGPLLTCILTPRPLQRTPEVPGGDPSLPVSQQAGGAAPIHGGHLPLGQHRAPPHLLPVPSLFALGARTVAQSQGGAAGSTPTTQSQSQRSVCRPETEGGDGVVADARPSPRPAQLLEAADGSRAQEPLTRQWVSSFRWRPVSGAPYAMGQFQCNYLLRENRHHLKMIRL